MFPRYHRRSTRLKGYDYTQAGVYFVTICAFQRLPLFGEITDGDMVLNAAGAIVQEEWLQTAVVRPYIDLDAFVVMPNHFHGILIITDDGQTSSDAGATRRVAPTQTLISRSLGATIGQFKSVVTKRIRQLPDGYPEFQVWQRNYRDDIIYNDAALQRIRAYIDTNPARWTEDTFYE